MTYALRTYRVTKSYQGNEVVSEVSINIRRGEIYGFLGPNGAGKTTLMKMMTNLVKPTSGEIEVLGQKLTDTSFELLGRMGSIIEYPIFYDKLTARENLDLHCEYMGYHDKKAIDEALELVNLHGIDKKMVKDFSLGMKQRLGIARAITTKPELLLLDEPINGLDPIGIKELRDLFRMLSREYGITLLISSHMLGEIEQMADTIGVINHGKLLAEVAMAEVREQNAAYIEIVTTNSQHAVFVLENRMNLTNLRLMNEQVIRIYDTDLPQNEIAKKLIMNDVIIESIHKKKQSLEDYFLTLLNGGGIHA
ncbi:ABC transporter ATP-binding protein [Paenibacillus thiaminolyticus]|uniref:ABC transporter ATP-binding protein n=1 Tax=Paenibacillus thiaminolyticus TaxID=49283 RepID=A0A3A3GME7_PANTH|nr:ABC transporter ATP-binding protein [Paenibacillus thiaminolyticus]RJG23836.1 ABC transporter ATP-binding protein [Paenibacillus thiaminolyticus]